MEHRRELWRSQVDCWASAANLAEVALEAADVDGVEADDHDGEVAAGKVVLAREHLHGMVKGCGERRDDGVVCLLRRLQPVLVHAV